MDSGIIMGMLIIYLCAQVLILILDLIYFVIRSTKN